MEAGSVPDDVFVCPECGRSFTRSQSLGIHRRSTHGVEGTARGSIVARAKRAEQKRTKGPLVQTYEQITPAARDAVKSLLDTSLSDNSFDVFLEELSVILESSWMDDRVKIAAAVGMIFLYRTGSYQPV